MTYFKVVAKKDCPYCIKAKLLLMERDQQFEFCTIDCSPELWEAYKGNHDHKTVPMIFLKDTGSKYERLIGGFDDLVNFFRETK